MDNVFTSINAVLEYTLYGLYLKQKNPKQTNNKPTKHTLILFVIATNSKHLVSLCQTSCIYILSMV